MLIAMTDFRGYAEQLQLGAEMRVFLQYWARMDMLSVATDGAKYYFSIPELANEQAWNIGSTNGWHHIGACRNFIMIPGAPMPIWRQGGLGWQGNVPRTNILGITLSAQCFWRRSPGIAFSES
jgi:hypothetical protein